MNWLDADEIVQGALRKKTCGARTAGALAMKFDQATETSFFLSFEFVRLHELAVEDIFHFAALNVGEAAGHAGAKINADRAENHGDSAGHVFAAMLADALDDRNGSAVTDGETLADLSCDEELAGGGAVQHRVAGEHVAAFGSVLTGVDDDGATGEAFADVIVRFTVKIQREAVRK